MSPLAVVLAFIVGAVLGFAVTAAVVDWAMREGRAMVIDMVRERRRGSGSVEPDD